MGLIETLATPPAPATLGRSVMDVWVDLLPANERTAVLNAVRNPEWRHTDLQAELIAAGAPQIADTTFRAWRKKQGWNA